jgi:sugar/nucleoside kinase (ribokinase family)
VDPNWDPAESWDGGLAELLPALDLFFPNEEEARRITGRATASDAARALRGERDGARPIVVVKRGAEGALAIDADGEETSIGAFEIEPLDSTGAGDAFDAGFLRAWLEGQPTSTCLSEAAAAGALSTRGLGGTSSLPTRADVEALVADGPHAR